MKQFLAVEFLIAIFAGLAVAWAPGRWPGALSQLAICALALAWIFEKIIRRGAIRPGFPVWPLLGLMCCGVIQLSLHGTVYAWDTQEALLYWFVNLLVLMVATDLGQDARASGLLLDGLFVGGTVLAVVSVVQVFTSEGYVFWLFRAPYREGVFGPFVYRNQYAAFIELLLPIALFRALAGRERRWAYVTATAMLYACSVASASRAGVILATAEVLVVSLAALANRVVLAARLVRIAAVFVLAASVFIAVVGPEAIRTRFAQRDLDTDRRNMLMSSVAMFRERPLPGFGLGTWPTVYPGYAIADDGLFANQAHNDWAQAAVEAGLPGLLCIAALFAWSAWAGWKTGWGLGIAFVLLHATVDYPVQRQALAACFWALAGLQAGSLTLTNFRCGTDR